MFFSKRAYFEKVQRRTQKGVQNGVKTVLRRTKEAINIASSNGHTSVEISFDISDKDKVILVADMLTSQGFTTKVESLIWHISLVVQW